MLGYEITQWCSILALALTPIPIVTKWSREVARILQLPDTKERFVAQGIDLASSMSEAFGALIKEVPKCRRS